MIKTVSIIGTGNVSWHLSHRLVLAGFRIDQIYGRNLNDKKYFDDLHHTEYITELKRLRDNAPLYILCVNDDAVEEILKNLPFELDHSQILVHTSGTLSINIFKKHANRYGCIWPVQTLIRGQQILTHQLPMVVTASDDQTAQQLLSIAEVISGRVSLLDDESKKKIHLGAVICNNFTNHLLTLTQRYCEEYQVPFELLKPLIKETVMKADMAKPINLQTGPARRNDKMTIEKHLEMLESDTELYKLYCLMSESILKTYYKN